MSTSAGAAPPKSEDAKRELTCREVIEKANPERGEKEDEQDQEGVSIESSSLLLLSELTSSGNTHMFFSKGTEVPPL